MLGFLFLAFSLLSFLFGILALKGKGGWFIAGAFATKWGAETFDQKKAYRVIAFSYLLHGIMFAIFSWLAFCPPSIENRENYPMILLVIAVVLYLVGTILMGCYLNFCCKKE